MKIIHPAAEQNFESKAFELIKLLRHVERSAEASPSFPADIHIAADITDADIFGDLEEKIVDYRGQTAGRIFHIKAQRIGLIGDSYKALKGLAESIQKTPQAREKLSCEFVENTIFYWLKNRFLANTPEQSFISFLEETAKTSIRKIIVRVPIALTSVETPFEFCGAVIENISKSMIDEMEELAKSKSPEQRNNILKFFSTLRGEIQGYAAATMNLECEESHAKSLGLETARRLTELLGIYSIAILIPDTKCVSKVKGTGNIEQFMMLLSIDGHQKMTREILDRSSGRPNIITNTDIEGYKKCGLDIISNIATKSNTTDFESTIASMAFLYSKAAFTADPMSKVVYILSALEMHSTKKRWRANSAKYLRKNCNLHRTKA